MARRFRFRLETVRRLREQARDAQRRVVAEAARAVRSVEDQVVQLTREVEQVSAQSREARSHGPMDTVLLQRHLHYRAWLKRRIAGCRAELVVKEAELERQRAKLAETRRDLKVIEKLRERQWERHLAEVAREQTLEHDEAAQQRFLRGRSQESEVVT